MMMITQEIAAKLPAVGSQGDVEDPMIWLKWFCPWSGWTWYVAEYDPKDGYCYGLVYGFEKEWGYFTLAEIEGIKGPGGLKIERDLHFQPKRASDCKDPCKVN